MHVLQRCNFRGNKNGKVLLISSGGAVNFFISHNFRNRTDILNSIYFEAFKLNQPSVVQILEKGRFPVKQTCC